MFKSITYGQLEQEQVHKTIVERIEEIKRKGYDYEISIGTDSQTYTGTNIVTSIVLRTMSKGSIFFSRKQRITRFNNLHQKIYAEVADTLVIAEALRKYMRDTGFTFQEVYDKLWVDIDVGENGETSKLIPAVTGWVTGCGFQWRIKPESLASSRVSDKLSKRGGDGNRYKPHVRTKK